MNPRTPDSRTGTLGAVPGAVAAAFLLAAACTVAAAPPTPAQQYQLALEAQSMRKHADMFALLRSAAEAGDVRAQETLGLVLLAAPLLYGAGQPAQPCEAWRWSRAAADQGSVVGRHQWELLGRSRGSGGVGLRCD